MLFSASVAFLGSRSFSDGAAVSAVLSAVVSAGLSVRVGCCVGADALVLRSSLECSSISSVSCYSAFGPDGSLSCSLSAVPVVSAFSAAGLSVFERDLI